MATMTEEPPTRTGEVSPPQVGRSPRNQRSHFEADRDKPPEVTLDEALTSREEGSLERRALTLKFMRNTQGQKK